MKIPVHSTPARKRRVIRMKLSARNQIRGTVTAVKEGAVEAQVSIDIGGGQTMVSVITMDSLANLGIKAGSQVYAVVKADSVMLAVD
jgi:molybdopterin-binding protein